MSAKLVKKLVEVLGGFEMKDSQVKAVIEAVVNTTTSKKADVKEYIRHYVKDTQKHKKGVIVAVSEKNITNQLFKLDDVKLKEVIKDLKNGKVIELATTKNASIYYKKGVNINEQITLYSL
jgi:TusA-related sulfurtransferase